MKSSGPNIRTLAWRFVIRVIVTIFAVLTSLFRLVPPGRRKLPDRGIRILLTGTFYSDNWIITHLRPLAAADSVAEVRMVASTVVPAVEGVTPVYAGDRLVRMVGPTAARLLTFARESFRWRPDVIGGFHLLLNGLVAQLLARLKSCHCLYYCGGGVREVEGGGFKTENRLFNRLHYRSHYVEHLLLRSATRFDFLITMGGSVRQFFIDHGAKGAVCVVPGGFDENIFCPPDSPATFDLVTVGRLSPVKRVEMLIGAVALLRSRGQIVSAAIVGDGPSMTSLQQLAAELEVADQIKFAGWQSQVEDWLVRSRVFTLTSESEGLSQAMIQGMLCGLPCVVPDVGDLKDLIDHGRNGLLMREQTDESFAAAYETVLFDRQTETLMSRQARQSALRLKFSSIAALWDDIFREDIAG